MRILYLTNYPIANPIHGGQIRATQIINSLRISNHEVLPVSIFSSADYPEFSGNDIVFDREAPFWRQSDPLIHDYSAGVFVIRDPVVLSKITTIERDFKPDVIVVEQPWLFALAKKLAQGKKTKLVFSSQNIEFKLKHRLLERSGNPNIETLVDLIRAVELEAVVDSDLLITCTEQDAQQYKLILKDALPKRFVVAGNGVEKFSCTDHRVEEWRNYLESPTAVFVSSAHMPNAQGFWDMLSPGLTFLPLGQKILILGGVVSILTQIPIYRNYSELNLSRLNMAGVRTKIELQALIRASHVVLLPISDGEGSNLKTAEALESGCHVVGTTKALRGFESAASLPQVVIADSAPLFRAAVKRALGLPRNTIPTPPSILEQFYWGNQLKSIGPEISGLFATA